MIQKNLYNPIPFHSSKDQWYNRRRTFKGGKSKLYSPSGYILPFQITLSKNTNYVLPSMSINGTHTAQMPFASDKIDFTSTDYGTIRLVPVGNKYKVYRITPTGTFVMYDGEAATEQHISLVTWDEFVALTGRKSFFNISVRPHTTTTYTFINIVVNYIKVEIFNDGGLVSDISSKTKLVFSLVPSSYRNDNARYMYGCCALTPLATALSEGCYYIKISVPLTGQNQFEYIFSEPFDVKSDISSLIHARYRTDSPIVKSNGYLPFKSVTSGSFSMEAYIDSYIMMPSCSFEEEVQDLNGYHFVQSRVSAIAHKFSFLATAYFAEAIILMWHCSLLRFHDGVDEYLVDYMKQPELSWNDDNHLAQVDVEFLTDTITQSEGYHVATTSRVMGGQFSEGFSNGFGV